MMASRGDSHFTTYLRVQKWRVLQIEVHPMSGENTKMPCWFEDRHLQEVLQLLKGTISDRVQLKRSDTGKNMSKSSIATGPTVRIGYVFRPKPEYQMCLLPTSQPLYTSDSEDEASSSSYQYRNLGLHHEKLVVYCCLLKENSHHNSMAQIMSVLGENSPQPKTASISSYFNRVIPPSSLSQPSAPTSGQSSPKDEEQTGTDTRKRKLKCIVKRSGPKLSKKAKKVKSSTVTHSDPSNEHTVDISSRDRETDEPRQTVTASTTSCCRDNYDDEFSRLSFYGDLPDNDEEIEASDKPQKKTSNEETHISSKILSIDDEFETLLERTKDNFQKNKEERKTSVLDEESDDLSTLRRVNTKTRKTLSTKNENLFPSESTLTTKCRADQTKQKSKPAKFSFKKCKLKNPKEPIDKDSDHQQSLCDYVSANNDGESDKGSCVESSSERENIISKDASISDKDRKRRYTSDSETSDVSLCLVMTPSPKYNKVRSSKLRERNIDAGSTLNNFVLPDLVTNSPISSGCSPSKDFGVPNSEQTYRNVTDPVPCANMAFNSDLNCNWPRLEKDESCDIDCDKGNSAIPKKDPKTESDTDLPQIKLKKRDRSWRKSLALIMNAKRSPEKYQDKEEDAVDCEKIDCDLMQDLAELPKHKMDLTEEFRNQLGQISDVSQLRESHIEKMVLGSKGYLQSIFMGKHHCTRHDDYKKGGSARFNLNFQVNLEMFTELQQDAVMEALMTIFCKRHHKYMDYILKVLLPEMLIWILMEIKHTSYDEAAALMSGDVDLDVGSGIGEDILLQ